MARRRNRIGLALGVVLAGTLGGGLALQYMAVPRPQSLGPRQADATPSAPAEPTAANTSGAAGAGGETSGMSAASAFDRHFQAAVKLLRSGRAAEALEMLNLARRYRPHMPEIYVNSGFALLRLGRPGDARLAFEKAVEIRPGQVNAYYGLAESLERLGDLRGALGAMRTYIHLVDKDDPFRTKAMAATWEWEAALAKEQAAAERPRNEPPAAMSGPGAPSGAEGSDK
ncbi:MAG: hypothetical protein COW30_08500 [Rhodospirillales bacterium CG15_BIG_FIL_POST_REV_8_21_14_020_66_15]|nr:MAG: hypothetical protein COW30_08500 [Rhodospirillales bacterium CG15_BIG_FIL_POST_REV_8_21_14_020_66_15]